MEYIANLSYGKDSIYMLEIIHQKGLPLDKIVHVEIMATPTISGDYPPMLEFKEKVDEFIKNRYGIEVEHIQSTYGSYEELVYKPITRGSRIGTNRGIASRRINWCNGQLKVHPLKEIQKNCNSYIGYAIDEKNPQRQTKIKEYLEGNNTNNYLYPLVDENITEQQAYEWCKENDVLAPNYEYSSRGGCWFCHNQSLGQWYYLYNTYPELYAMAEKWEEDSNGFTYRNDYNSLKKLRKERFEKDCITKRDLKKLDKGE